MGLFSLGKKSDDRYGALVDIGSGSVTVAIVYSDPAKTHPTVVWKHCEHAPLRNVQSIDESVKTVAAALMQATMKLDSEGRKVLSTFRSSAELTELQVAYSAPWAYTITKALNYSQKDESFTISSELIDELSRSAEEKIQTDIKANETLADRGLSVISQSTISLIANGYRLDDVLGQSTRTLDLSHVSVVAQKHFTNAVQEIHGKLFPGTTLRSTSEILMMYCVARDVLDGEDDFCLIDVTYEATELAIVRDGILQYCTYESHGAFSLAREISAITDLPLHEAFGYLSHDPDRNFLQRLSVEKKQAVEEVLTAYKQRLADLFHQTGDSLSIPKKIYLLSDLQSNTLLEDVVARSAKSATQIEPIVASLSTKLIELLYADVPKSDHSKVIDATTLASAQFFHKRQHCNAVNYR